VCFYACEQLFEPDLQDPYNCVLDMQGNIPSGFQAIPYTNAEIVKTSFETPVAGVCPEGYTKWQANKCFIDCPLNFPDLGPTCMVPSLTRSYTSPTCGFLSYQPSLGSNCILSPWGIALYILLIVVGMILVFQLVKMFSNKFGYGNNNSRVLNKIQGYIRTDSELTAMQAQQASFRTDSASGFNSGFAGMQPTTLNFFLRG
jgi:hypothetical protein